MADLENTMSFLCSPDPPSGASSSSPAPGGWEVTDREGMQLSHWVQLGPSRSRSWTELLFLLILVWSRALMCNDKTPNSVPWTHVSWCFSCDCRNELEQLIIFFTQRACLLLLVFISINFISAGLTQITTSLSCTFDLKIKLIWEVFKALLIFMWPLEVAVMLTRFFLN